MQWINKLVVYFILFLDLGAHAMPPTAPLQEKLALAIQGGDYQPAPVEEVKRAEALFLRLARGTDPAQLADEAKSLAVRIESVGPYVIIREEENAKRGRGFFVLRSGARPDILLVPHGFKDEMTRAIGLNLFEQGSFAAAAWNTVPRDYLRNGVKVDADMAHLPTSWFTAFAVATASVWPQGQTLQIHGFEQAKRKSMAAAQTDMILSNGTRTPGAQLMQQQKCLAETLGRPVQLYSDSFRELGGTTNVQAAALRERGYQGFVHMELSRSLRLALRDEAHSRTALLKCMQP